MLVAAAQFSRFGLMREPPESAVTSVPETRAAFLAHLVARMARGDTERGSVQAWLVIMARSMAIDRIRQRKAQADTPTFNAVELASLVAPDSSPETQTEDARLRCQVAAVLRTLPPEQQEVLELAFFSGFTHSELALHLGQPLGTVKSRIRMAVGRLRSLLDQNMRSVGQGVGA